MSYAGTKSRGADSWSDNYSDRATVREYRRCTGRGAYRDYGGHERDRLVSALVCGGEAARHHLFSRVSRLRSPVALSYGGFRVRGLSGICPQPPGRGLSRRSKRVCSEDPRCHSGSRSNGTKQRSGIEGKTSAALSTFSEPTCDTARPIGPASVSRDTPSGDIRPSRWPAPGPAGKCRASAPSLQCHPTSVRSSSTGPFRTYRRPSCIRGAHGHPGVTPAVRKPGGGYDLTPPPKYYVEFNRANHLSWTGLPIFRKAHSHMISYGLAFMDHYVKGEPARPLLTCAVPGVTRFPLRVGTRKRRRPGGRRGPT